MPLPAELAPAFTAGADVAFWTRHMAAKTIVLPQTRPVKTARNSIAISILLLANSLVAGTTLDSWHSYVHAQTRERHYGFHLAQCKRGIFWGSCGPSTKSLQWSFTFDLAGDGPVYDAKRISISDD